MEVSVFDLETDGIYPTKIHVLSVCEGGVLKSTPKYENMKSWFSKDKIFVAHNCIRYDLVAVERLLGVKPGGLVVDTLALSWYLFPDRRSHGLESWGEDFGVRKPPIDDWENLSYEEYRYRCEQDVLINKMLWDKCWEYLLKLYGSEEDALRLVRYLSFKLDCIKVQEKLKWKLDVGLCSATLEKLEVIKEKKVTDLSNSMPKIPVYKLTHKPKKLYTISGSLSKAGEAWFDMLKKSGLPEEHEDPVEVLHKVNEPNPNSHTQIKDWLYSLGWVPETFEFKRNKETREVKKIPQVSIKGEGVCPSVKRLFEKEPKLEVLDGLSIVSHRIAILKGFLDNVDNDGYIQASVAGLTNTLRFKHSVLVNLPGIDKPFGEEIRGCLIAPEGYELCGSDMSSLEDRTKQHYMWEYDPDYVAQMMTPDFDPHIDLAEFAGAISQKEATDYKGGDKSPRVAALRKIYKGVNYACVYGAGGATVGRTAGVSTQEGEKLVESYWRRNWSVKEIANNTKIKVVNKDKWLYNPVSRLYYSLRADKDKFSTLNQSTGVWCFDYWVAACKRNGLCIIGQFHDEIIALSKVGCRESVERSIKLSMEEVNETLKLNRSLDCSVQFGDRYSDIH